MHSAGGQDPRRPAVWGEERLPSVSCGFYPVHPESPGPEHLSTQRHSHSQTPATSSATARPLKALISPLGAVPVAGLALARPVGVFPDHRVPVSQHAVGAACHTVGAVLRVCAAGTLVGTLQEVTRDGPEFLNRSFT